MNKLFIVVNVDTFFLSHRREIAVEAGRSGYEVTVVTKDTGHRQEIEALGARVIDLPINKSGRNLWEEGQTFRFLYALYRREKPAVVHHVGLKVILWGTLAAKWAANVGVVNAVSGLGILFSEEQSTFFSKLMLLFLKYAHRQKNLAVIFQNEEDRSLFLRSGVVRQEQTFLIKGSGIDLKRFAYTPEPEDEKIRVLFTGRMIREKGVMILIAAAGELEPKWKDKVEFWLCGGLDTNPAALTENELQAVCDGKYIRWLGYRTDVLALLRASHIMAFPSYYREGLPKSLIEAAAVGRPIITTCSVGCKEAVEEGYNGFLVPIKDSHALAGKLRLLLKDKELRQRFGKNSRLLAEKYFSVGKVVNEHLKIYRHLLIETGEDKR